MSEHKYFYIDNGNQVGPVSAEELVSKATPQTAIWCPGMDNWAPASTVQEISALMSTGIPPATAPTVQQADGNPYSGNSNAYGSQQQTDGYSGNYGNAGYGNNYGQQPQGPGPRPDNYLVWAIVTTIICCWPFSIVSIINAAKVDAEWNAGRYDDARKASDKAKKFAIISAAVAVGCWILYAIFYAMFLGATLGKL